MAFDPISAIATAGAGILNFFGQKDANEKNAAAAAQNIALQKQFAQEGIRWKVADAQAAGIHPLYALGANTTSFSPVSVGAQNAFGGLADMAKNLGQDLSRSVDATRTGPERVAARAQSMATGLTVENMQLRNDLLRAQIAKLNSSQVGPPMPSSGSGDTFDVAGGGSNPGINPKPMDVVPGAPGQGGSERGAITDVGYARTSTGWAPVPSKDVKERIEDQFIPEMMWALRNNLMPSVGMNQVPPPYKAPPGKRWIYNVMRQEYQLENKSRSLWSANEGWSKGYRWP